VEVRGGKDDAVEEVVGHVVDVLHVLVPQPPEDGSDSVADLLIVVEWRADRLQVGTALLLDVRWGRELCKSSF
jgi:hypothetical protein